MGGLNTLIEQHPAVVVLIFGLLWSILTALLMLVAWFMKRELARIWSSEQSQDAKLASLEADVHGEEGDLRSIRERLEQHITVERETLKSMGAEVSATARAVIRIEANMPNGDLKVAVAKLDEVSTDLKDHNREAEKWKRTITAHGVRIDKLEEGGRR